MEKNKKIIIPALVIATVLGVGAYSISGAQAGNGNGRSFLVEKISSRFSLNKDDVQKVFDDNRNEMQKDRQSNYEEVLSKAVSDGKLPEAQKQLILDKRAEMEKEREQNRADHKDLSLEERKTKMEERKAEIEKWAKDNSIDVGYLFGIGNGGHGNGMGLGRNANR